jgi:hypothetical protein
MCVRILSRAVSRIEKEEDFVEEEEDFVVLFCRLKGRSYVNMGVMLLRVMLLRVLFLFLFLLL